MHPMSQLGSFMYNTTPYFICCMLYDNLTTSLLVLEYFYSTALELVNGIMVNTSREDIKLATLCNHVS